MHNNALRPAKVIRFHGKHCADIVFTDTGARVPRVQILSASASSNSGAVKMAQPTEPLDESGFKPTKGRDTYAVVAFMGNVPVIMGFYYPQVSEMHFEDVNREIERHPSGVYSTIDGAGNIEVCHPSGTFLRIGTTPAHEDLTGADIDGKWSIEQTDDPIHVRLQVKNAGVVKATISVTPDGDVSVVNSGDLIATTAGDAQIAVTGNITSSAAAWNHTGPFNLTGDMAVTGDATVQGTVTGVAGVTGAGKHLATHTHGGVTAGAGTSGAPT